jgi:23S rRNA (pseudouridine1915-N3)-methyltransferase
VGRCPAREGRLRVRVASIGKDRSGLFKPGVDEYAERLGHYTKFSLVELPEGRGDKAKAQASEAEALLELANDRDWLVALDERGKLLTTDELARFIAQAQSSARDLLFVIGGDEGLSSEVTSTARLTLSLSMMTLPHRLARLVRVEQVYRAFTVLKGEPYHK